MGRFHDDAKLIGSTPGDPHLVKTRIYIPQEFFQADPEMLME